MFVEGLTIPVCPQIEYFSCSNIFHFLFDSHGQVFNVLKGKSKGCEKNTRTTKIQEKVNKSQVVNVFRNCFKTNLVILTIFIDCPIQDVTLAICLCRLVSQKSCFHFRCCILNAVDLCSLKESFFINIFTCVT